MEITFEFIGLKEIQKSLEQLASDAEMSQTNKKIFKRCVDVAEPRMKRHMPKSGNNAKSGRRGYRPPGHAADNIPKKVSAKEGTVGWKMNGDAENWFYMKFVEWGTSKMPPRDFIENTREESDAEFSSIADQEYQALLNAKLG